MATVGQMLETHPGKTAVADALTECISACVSCAQSCTSCADACLGEQKPEMLARCIRLNLDCADICAATGRIATRLTARDDQLLRATLDACATACRICAGECEMHAQHGMEHCRICAEECRRCETACMNLIRQLTA